MLKFVYGFFLGLLLTVFVGMGVATFYAAPQPPEYPKTLEQRVEPSKEYTAAERKLDQDYQAAYQKYNEQAKDYNRNVSMIVLGAAVILLVLGLAMHTKVDVLADGLLLGGTFTLLYSIGRSFASEDPKYSFVVVSVGLIVTMLVGYRKFIQPVTAPASKKRKR